MLEAVDSSPSYQTYMGQAVVRLGEPVPATTVIVADNLVFNLDKELLAARKYGQTVRLMGGVPGWYPLQRIDEASVGGYISPEENLRRSRLIRLCRNERDLAEMATVPLAY